MAESKNIAGIRDDFPLLSRRVHGEPLAYLDNAATTQKPRQVLDAMEQYYVRHNANIHRGVHTLAGEATDAYEGAREKVARFIGARSQDIIFTKNATEALNIPAYGLGLGRDDAVMVTELEHHANFVPWQQQCIRTGARFLIARQQDGMVDIEQVKELVAGLRRTTRGPANGTTTAPKLRVLAVTQTSNALGTNQNIRELADIAHDAGALLVADGAQCIPHQPTDVRKIGADFLAFSGHKMLGPTGIGVLWGTEDALSELSPFIMGGDMIRKVGKEDTEFAELPHRFEAGTPPIAEAVGLGAAVDYLSSLGMEQVHEHVGLLGRKAREALSVIDGVRVLGDAGITADGRNANASGIASFTAPAHPHDMSTLLDAQGIAVRGGHHCAMPLMAALGVNGTTRASFYVYNDIAEVRLFTDAVAGIAARWQHE
ncbi:hypothetical protein AUJ68_04855 [Candidatus Woesearchaeota archaeon CG1_02_57_44]|nr:MAG: hypothetical protein AUJ68_04855 [Candidatus Woesearchaeota archaeon CG1_02_57_44]